MQTRSDSSQNESERIRALWKPSVQASAGLSDLSQDGIRNGPRPHAAPSLGRGGYPSCRPARVLLTRVRTESEMRRGQGPRRPCPPGLPRRPSRGRLTRIRTESEMRRGRGPGVPAPEASTQASTGSSDPSQDGVRSAAGPRPQAAPALGRGGFPPRRVHGAF